MSTNNSKAPKDDRISLADEESVKQVLVNSVLGLWDVVNNLTRLRPSKHDRYLRGSNGYKAEERVKLMKLLWDCIATEFGGRHELYEINYSGSHEEIRRYALFGALASGQYDRWKQFAESCMAEYDVDGWKAKDLINVKGLGVEAK